MRSAAGGSEGALNVVDKVVRFAAAGSLEGERER